MNKKILNIGFQLPLLDSRRLQTIEEYRRAFLIMCMLSHSYVWGKLEQASEVRKKKKKKLRNNRKKKLTQLFSRQSLPAQLAIPWTNIADHLGLCPVVCHAAVVLWNYRMLDQEEPLDLK